MLDFIFFSKIIQRIKFNLNNDTVSFKIIFFILLLLNILIEITIKKNTHKTGQNVLINYPLII